MFPAPVDRLHELAFTYSDAIKSLDAVWEEWNALNGTAEEPAIDRFVDQILDRQDAIDKAQQALLAEARTR